MRTSCVAARSASAIRSCSCDRRSRRSHGGRRHGELGHEDHEDHKGETRRFFVSLLRDLCDLRGPTLPWPSSSVSSPWLSSSRPRKIALTHEACGCGVIGPWQTGGLELESESEQVSSRTLEFQSSRVPFPVRWRRRCSMAVATSTLLGRPLWYELMTTVMK